MTEHESLQAPTHPQAHAPSIRSLDDVDGLRRKRRAREQEWLLPYKNPLQKKFDAVFFKNIPTSAGVYRMYSGDGELLYVGKAKNLRNRLRSYRGAKPDSVTRKTIRLINQVEKIEWSLCASEEEALLLENRLLRRHRPPYNVVNTSPESYYFIGFSALHSGYRFTLTTQSNPESDGASTLLFGAFKGRSSVREGYSALLRLIWAAHHQSSVSGDAKPATSSERFMFPTRLCSRKPCYRYELKTRSLHIEHERLIARFLRGTSPALLAHLTERLLENEGIPPFCYRVIQDDLEALRDFYDRVLKRNRRLLRLLHDKKPPPHTQIAQEQLDDLIVRDRFQNKL